MRLFGAFCLAGKISGFSKPSDESELTRAYSDFQERFEK